MSQGEELLNTLSEEDISLYSANPATEEHIVVGADRFITVPASLQRLAVQYDHNVETVTFDCPRYWDGLDMSQLVVVINYIRPDGQTGSYPATNIRVDDADESTMHFDWTIDWHVTEAFGNLTFLVCIRKSDAEGNDINHWNSELNTTAKISKGLDCEGTVADRYPSLITQLLTRLGTVEETVDGYSNDIYALQVKDAFLDSEIAQIDEMYIELEERVSTIEENGVPGSGGETVQANYEQNYPTAADYIQNRPFYDTGEVEITDITLVNNLKFSNIPVPNWMNGDLSAYTSAPSGITLDTNPLTTTTCSVTLGGVTKEFPVKQAYIEEIGNYYYIGDDLHDMALNLDSYQTSEYGFSIIKYDTYSIDGSNVGIAITDANIVVLVTFELDMATIGEQTLTASQYHEENVGLKKIDPKYLPDLPKTVGIDFSDWDSGAFSETLEDGTVISHEVTFNDDGEVISIDGISISGVS